VAKLRTASDSRLESEPNGSDSNPHMADTPERSGPMRIRLEGLVSARSSTQDLEVIVIDRAADLS